jgi:hypothetical protein
MRTVSLLEKCYGPYAHQGLEELSRHIKRSCKELDVEIHSVGCDPRGWVEVAFAGGDEEVFVSYLEEEFGLAIGSMDHVVVGETLRGKIITSGSVGYGLYVDLGVSCPGNIDALIPLTVLRTQLAGGSRISLQEIVHTFCLFDNLTLDVIPKKVDLDKSIIEAYLSDSQLSTLNDWVETNLERIVVIGATGWRVKNSVSRSGHERDVLSVEDLGLLESSVICKLGTHARGLIPDLGRFMQRASLHVFLPRDVCRLRDLGEGSRSAILV